MADLTDYTDLIPSANAEKPNFLAMLGVALQPFVDSINTIETLPMKLDPEMAVGDQLDIVGEWVNFARDLAIPIVGVYFSLGVAGPGLGAGIWFNPSDSLTQLTRLDDITYRKMILAQIAANNWDGSLAEANAALVAIFGSQGDPPVIWIVDNMNMTMSYRTSSPVILLQQLVANGFFPFKVTGVQLT